MHLSSWLLLASLIPHCSSASSRYVIVACLFVPYKPLFIVTSYALNIVLRTKIEACPYDSPHEWECLVICLESCLFFFQFECCGVTSDSYKDWSMNIYFNCSEENISPDACGVPYSCCKEQDDITVSFLILTALKRIKSNLKNVKKTWASL